MKKPTSTYKKPRNLTLDEIQLRQWCVDQAGRFSIGAEIIPTARKIFDWINGNAD